MLDVKILLAIIFLYSLIMPLSIKPVSGLYDIGELTALRAYCFLHADRAAQGENVVNDLITAGLAKSTYHDWSCSKISETLQAEENAVQAEEKAKSERANAFYEKCTYGNKTPSQYWECDRAGYSPGGILCLFEEDREEAQKRLSENVNSYIPGRLDTYPALDLSRVEPLTPAEQLECKNTGHEPGLGEDKDTKESDK